MYFLLVEDISNLAAANNRRQYGKYRHPGVLLLELEYSPCSALLSCAGSFISCPAYQMSHR